MGFISRKAKVRGFIIESAILGPSEIGEGTLIGPYVIVGYPSRESLRHLSSYSLEDLDSISRGVRIGRHCIIRSNTVVYENVIIGDEVEFGHGVLVRENTIVGDGSLIGSGTIIDGDVRIGRRVRIQSMCYIPRGTVIEDEAFLGPCVVVTNDKYPPSKRLTPVIIRKGAVVGAGAVILPGVEIGEKAVVGAGAVVTKDVRPGEVVAGFPARFMYGIGEYMRKKAFYEATSP